MEHTHLEEEISGKKLLITIFLNFLITAVEAAGGILSGSLSLLSDALHNFSDGMAVIISYIAVKLSLLEASPRKTFGYKRAEVFAAFVNAIVLIVISIFIFREAFERFFNPVEIRGTLMVSVAFVGLVANLFAVFLLREESKKNINIRSAFVHLVADSVSSVGVLLGGVFIILFEFYLIDPVLTLIIGIYVLKEGYTILNRTINIIMQSVPVHIDIFEVKKEIETINGVNDVHHIHIWQLSERDIFFDAHVDLRENVNLSEGCQITSKIEHLLKEKFNINNVTIQLEYAVCEDRAVIKQTGRRRKKKIS